MFERLLSNVKARVDIALKSAACGMIAALAAVIALAFFCAAAFIALAARRGTVDACLIFGGAFVLVAAIAATLVRLLRRRAVRNKVNLAQAADPQTLAIGNAILQLLGGRRAASLGLVGAFIIGVLLSRSVPPK